MFGVGFGAMGVVILNDGDCEEREAVRAPAIGLGVGPEPGGRWRGWLISSRSTATRAWGGVSCRGTAGTEGRGRSGTRKEGLWQEKRES